MYMQSLLVQNDFGWAPKFLETINKQERLRWLVEKIRNESQLATEDKGSTPNALVHACTCKCTLEPHSLKLV